MPKFYHLTSTVIGQRFTQFSGKYFRALVKALRTDSAFASDNVAKIQSCVFRSISVAIELLLSLPLIKSASQ